MAGAAHPGLRRERDGFQQRDYGQRGNFDRCRLDGSIRPDV